MAASGPGCGPSELHYVVWDLCCGAWTLGAACQPQQHAGCLVASVVAAAWLSSCGMKAPERTGLAALQHLSSLTSNWVLIPWIASWILNYWTTRGIPRLIFFFLRVNSLWFMSFHFSVFCLAFLLVLNSIEF